jgi:Protein of unknown function (DUF3052)
LGIKPGMIICVINKPHDYNNLIGEMASEINIQNKEIVNSDFVHFFTNRLAELEDKLPVLKQQIKKNGSIWVSWFKKSSGKPSELSDQVVRETALALGLVDVKVCSVSDDWSGLKLVFRLKDRG